MSDEHTPMHDIIEAEFLRNEARRKPEAIIGGFNAHGDCVYAGTIQWATPKHPSEDDLANIRWTITYRLPEQVKGAKP